MKFTNWNEKQLRGTWVFSFKKDGVRIHFGSDTPTTRKGTPYSNVPNSVIKEGQKQYCEIAEVFCGDWETTLSNLSSGKEISLDQIYTLEPHLDKRLLITVLKDPTVNQIKSIFSHSRLLGNEGIVMRNKETGDYVKVKPSYTHDIKITGFTEGKGKFKGMLGKVHTDMGDVGTGFTKAVRQKIWENRKDYEDQTIEVRCMELTKNKKFRHPVFVRFRTDK